jgi:hypothetical protein
MPLAGGTVDIIYVEKQQVDSRSDTGFMKHDSIKESQLYTVTDVTINMCI